jgi:pyridoxine 4-dehydrogenase
LRTQLRNSLQGAPDRKSLFLVIATKGPITRPDGFRQAVPADMRGLVEANLDGLGVGRLDLVYLRIGAMAPPHGESLAERFEALAALREEGLIRHLGLSNIDTAHLAEARAIAPVVAVQNQFHAAKRDDAELLAACEDADIAFVPFFPMGGGRELDDARLAKVAARHGAAVSQIGLAWLLASSPVTLAIPGMGSPSHLEDNMAVAGITFSEEDLADLS